MGSSRPVTPASPRAYRVQPAQPGLPLFGCDHIQMILESNIAIMKCYHICLQRISMDSSTIRTWVNANGKVITSLTPTYLCLQCSTTVPSEGRLEHGTETQHRLYVESRSGTLYCQMCDDFVWDPTLEEAKMQRLQPRSSAARKRKLDELASPTKDRKEDSNFMSSNTVVAPCKNASGLRGIYNMGATCYMNVILQSFVHNPLLRNFYFSDGHPNSTCQKPNCMSCSMERMFQAFYNEEETTGYSAAGILANFWLSPRAAYVELASNKEQDAHEFFQFLSEELHEIQSAALQAEALAQPSPKRVKAEDSSCKCIIHQTFYGKSQSTITCHSCRDVSVQEESFLDLSLGLDLLSKKKSLQAGNLSIQKCLDAEYKHSQTVEYSCREPDCRSQMATKHIRIRSLPNVLCLQLKRFGQQSAGMGASKIDTKVSFPLKLDMSPYTTKYKPESSQSQAFELSKSCTYDLQTVVVHVGNLETGHYVSYSRVGDQWFKFNDHKVTLASKSQVLNEEAFLLFYVIQSLV